MFLQLSHQKLDVFQVSRTLTLECYRVTKLLPPDERFAMVQQLRRAALSTHLNIAEGCSRKSVPERRRFFEISRGSVIEIDACLDIAARLNYFTVKDLSDFGPAIIKTFQMLTKMMKS